MTRTTAAEMERRLSNLHQRLEDIHEIAWAISSRPQLEQILSGLMEVAIRTIGAEVGGIFERTDEEVRARTAWGLDSETISQIRIGEDDPVTAVYHTHRLLEGREQEMTISGSRLQVHALMAVPIVVRKEMCGVLVLANGPDRGSFSADARDTAELLVSLAAVAIQNARLLHEAMEREKLHQQLELARTVQNMLLPAPTMATSPLRWQATYLPAYDVGGDYYDILPVPGDRWVIAIGDVSDHGIAAALLMTAVRSVVRRFAAVETDPAAIMARVNASLCGDFARQEGMFVSLFLAAVDPAARRLTYTNAGHPAPLYWDLERLLPAGLTTGGPILGQFEEATYTQADLPLGTGWRLFAFTDGVTESHNLRGDLFGTQRIQAYAAAHAWIDPAAFLRGLRTDLERFAGGSCERDDTTLLWVGEEPDHGAS